jgi:uncharacterized protein (UPF0332 family)
MLSRKNPSSLLSLTDQAEQLQKNNECVIIGVGELFTGKGKLPSNLVTKIKNAKYARETADYGCTYDEVAAQGIIADAEEVFRIIENFLTKG